MKELLEPYVFGVEGLDRLLGGSIQPPYVVVIAGHPGSGKTTLASTICYRNSLANHKCLYISLQEDKDKLFRFMSRLGLDLEGAESKGLLKFFKIPVTLDIESSVEMLKLTSIDNYDVLVIDSINALLEAVKDDAGRRAWLQNFFYSLPKITNGLVILNAELPYGSEELGLGSIEFIADAVLILKHRVEDGFSTRVLEVRKARGVPTTLAETPFSISEGRGVEIWVPPLLEGVRVEGRELQLPCGLLRKVFDHIHKGQVVNLVYPPDSDCLDLPILLLNMAMLNDLRLLFISYKHPRESIKEQIVNKLMRQGIERAVAEEVIDKHVVFVSVNPFSCSPTQLTARELTLVDNVNADVVVFHGVELPRQTIELRKHIRELYNEMNYLRKGGKLVIRIGAYNDDLTYGLESSVADAVVKLEYVDTEAGEVAYKAFMWRSHRKPYIASQQELNECVDEVIETLKTQLIK